MRRSVRSLASYTKHPYFVSLGDGLNIFSGGQYVTKVGNPDIARGSRTVQNGTEVVQYRGRYNHSSRHSRQRTTSGALRLRPECMGSQPDARDIPLWERDLQLPR